MARLADAVKMVADEADYVHCDVMDGHFVPNLTFGAPVVKALKKASPLPLDVHLMIEKPGRWIDDYIAAGLDERDFLLFHIEAEGDSYDVIHRIRAAGVRPGIAVKPKTGFSQFREFIDLVDQVLIMTVEPGFGGQKFMSENLEKVRLTRNAAPTVIIGIDGGIDIDTAPAAVVAGANLLVVGNAIFGKADPAAAAREIKRTAAQLTVLPHQ